MSTVEPESIGDLIADCADIPPALTSAHDLPGPRAAAPWSVDEKCVAQVEEPPGQSLELAPRHARGRSHAVQDA